MTERDIDRSDAIEVLEGYIDEVSRRPDADDLSPVDLKRDWASDL
ncbi:hypothetical protein SAMN06269185_2049 [Natronoarchaeum philippinense]|uniref:Uncharacterized protein n=1 Tax=Natronoarchaeum philippinense TaxID=558529 RepID=A0A285NUG8_NATPI|nr:hypothetical protein [Natronoarchaeum philippinense]SNZ13120.1 hypothetical protein SAMN06269185_2049 [Natronoarchaeum philippinense]